VILHPSPALTRVELAAPPGPEAPAHVERIIDGLTLLARGSPETMLDAALELPSGHRLDWTLGAEAGSWQLRRSQLSIAGGLGLAVELDRPTGQVLAALDGRHTLCELLADAPRDAPLDRLAELLRASLIGVSRPGE
jgi:hypothetical protein